MRNLFVGNLSFQTTEAELLREFQQFGDTCRATIAVDRGTGQSRGFAFVEMSDNDDAMKAIAGLNGHSMGGRLISVSEGRRKPERVGPRATSYSGGCDLRDRYSTTKPARHI